MKQKYKLLIKFALLFLILLMLSGCNESLMISDYQIHSEYYEQEGYFLPKRIVDFSVDIKNKEEKNLDYKWTANGGQILERNEEEIKYLTPNVPGDYTLFLTVKDENGEQIKHEFSFAVKGNYPSEIKLNDLETDSVKSGIKIDWSQYQDDDFYTYKILRSNNNFIDEEAEVIATIDDQEQSSYTDYNINPQQVYSYQVMVINKSGYLSISDEKMIETLPQKISKIDLQGQLSDFVIDEARSKLYLNNEEENSLLIVDEKSQKIKQKVKWDFGIKKLFLGAESDYLFALGDNKQKLIKLNLNDFSQKKYSFPSEIRDISIAGETIYLALAEEPNLIKFDIKAGEITEKLTITHNQTVVDAAKIDVSKGKYLFVDKVFGESLIYNLDDLTEPTAKFDLGIVKNSKFCNIEGESCLYIANTHHPLQVYSGIESGTVELKNKFDQISTPKDFAVDEENNRIFAAVDKKIYVYSLDDNQLIDKIKLEHYINRLAWHQEQEKLYLLTSQINKTNYNLMIADLKQFDREDNT